MAETNTFAVRMENEDKEKLVQLIDGSGKSSKEFMTVLMNSYKLNQMKSEVPEMAEDIKHLESITTQICEVYINIGKRINSIGEAKAIQYDKDLSIYKEKIISLENDLLNINTANTDLINDNLKLNTDKEDAAKQLIVFQNSIDDKTKIIEDKINIIIENKEKIDNLLGMIKDIKTLREGAETFKELLACSQAKNDELKVTIDRINIEHGNTLSRAAIKNEKDVNDLKTKISKLEELSLSEKLLHKKGIDHIIKEHSKEIETINRSLEFEKEKALLGQEKKFNKIINDNINESNNKMATIQDNYNNKISIIQEQSNSQILEYQKQYDKLIQDNKGKMKPTNNGGPK
ncbi:hypothetical protein [Clostridium estertheticum]|uniref:hypothetical protein n=1 Tax=Clostridium estertheticum TaxID=238834 RepID=UPI001C0CD93D|nr:hypothetical protein [Clostridium estertheticum]MBU3173358.1 hypothetical protein [Clostridium estertheticum]